MVRPDMPKWGQTVDDFRRLATESAHPRTRERFLALFMIASGQSNATLWAEWIDRCDECVMGWVHTDNEHGPDAMTYRRSGGHAPFLRPRSAKWRYPSREAPQPDVATPLFYARGRRTHRRNRTPNRTEHARHPRPRVDTEDVAAGDRR